MIFRGLLISVLASLSLSIIGQDFEKLSKSLLQKSEITDETFDQSIDSIQTGQWATNDSVRQYNNWLNTNKDILLSSQSSFFKVHYFIELAKTNEALNEYQSAYQNIDSALSYFDHTEFPDSYLKILMLGTSISKKKGDYTTTIRYLKEMINSGILANDSIKTGETLIVLSSKLLNMHRYLESMKYCNKALPIFQEMDCPDEMVELLQIMYSSAFHTSADTSNWEYLYQAREIALTTGDSILLAGVYETFGLAYYRTGNQLEAIRYYKLSRSLIKEKGSRTELGVIALQHLSYTLIDSVEAGCALSKYFLEQSLKNNNLYLSNAYRARAWCFAKHGQKDSTVYYLDKSAQERESMEKADASPGYYYYMYQIAMIINDYERAMHYLSTSFEQFRIYKLEANAKDLSDIRAQFDYELQKERIKKLRLENRLKKERNTRQQIIIIAIVLFLAIVIVFVFIYRKQIKNLQFAYQNLVKKNLELDKASLSLKALEIKNTSKPNGIYIKDEEKIYLKLKALLEDEKIFRQQDLSESKLAELLNTNTSYLSSIINKRFKMPFKTLLNKYRVAEARNLLVSKKYSNFSIEGIATEVGYQSRSAFYAVFKQNTGMTPSAYVKAYTQLDD
jgi:YesN/AraC family two-component response regulator